jgi:hypothetical protein
VPVGVNTVLFVVSVQPERVFYCVHMYLCVGTPFAHDAVIVSFWKQVYATWHIMMCSPHAVFNNVKFWAVHNVHIQNDVWLASCFFTPWEMQLSEWLASFRIPSNYLCNATIMMRSSHAVFNSVKFWAAHNLHIQNDVWLASCFFTPWEMQLSEWLASFRIPSNYLCNATIMMCSPHAVFNSVKFWAVHNVHIQNEVWLAYSSFRGLFGWSLKVEFGPSPSLPSVVWWDLMKSDGSGDLMKVVGPDASIHVPSFIQTCVCLCLLVTWKYWSYVL